MDRLTAGLTGGWFDRQAARWQEGGTDTYLFNESLVGDQKVKQYSDFSFVAIELRGP